MPEPLSPNVGINGRTNQPSLCGAGLFDATGRHSLIPVTPNVESPSDGFVLEAVFGATSSPMRVVCASSDTGIGPSAVRSFAMCCAV